MSSGKVSLYNNGFRMRSGSWRRRSATQGGETKEVFIDGTASKVHENTPTTSLICFTAACLVDSYSSHAGIKGAELMSALSRRHLES